MSCWLPCLMHHGRAVLHIVSVSSMLCCRRESVGAGRSCYWTPAHGRPLQLVRWWRHFWPLLCCALHVASLLVTAGA